MLTLIDLDIAGLGIAADVKKPEELSAADLFDTKRIGVTLDDAEEYNLLIEPADYAENMVSAIENKHNSSEVDDEVYEFLTANSGQRVEINAFRPAELKDYLETKFAELEVTKVHPEVKDVEMPEVSAIEDIKKDVRSEAVGEWVLSECRSEVLGEIEGETLDGDERDVNIGEDLDNVPTGDDAKEKCIKRSLTGSTSFPRNIGKRLTMR